MKECCETPVASSSKHVVLDLSSHGEVSCYEEGIFDMIRRVRKERSRKAAQLTEPEDTGYFVDEKGTFVFE